MKRSFGRMFIKGFIQSFFIVAILLSTGVLGYKLTMNLWKAPEEEAIVAYQDETVPETVTEAQVDDISKNLIYCYNEETKEITKVVLEIFHCDKNQLTYITIPMRTQLSMSETLYRKMVLVNPAIPQMMQLTTMTNYLDEDVVFDYGVLIIQDLLGTEISYYTVIPQTTYDSMFKSKVINTSKKGETAGNTASEDQILPVEAFRDDYIKFLKTLKTEDDIRNYIEEIYPKLKSNLTITDKMKYLESYSATPISSVSFELVKGKDTNSAFILEPELVTQRILELSSGE